MDTQRLTETLKEFGARTGAALLDLLKAAGAAAAKKLSEFFAWTAEAISSWFSSLTLPMLPTFMKIFANKSVNKTIFFALAAFLILINVRTFMLFGIDKKNAASKKNRVSEKKLMRLCFWGGAAGGLVGMLVFRHKTLHKKFSVGVPVMFAVQLVVWSFILGFLGYWAFF